MSGSGWRTTVHTALADAIAGACAVALALAMTGCSLGDKGQDNQPTTEQASEREQDQQETQDQQDPAVDEPSDPSEAAPDDSAPEEPVVRRDYSQLEARINEVIAPYAGNVSVVYVPIDDPQGGVRIDADQQMRSASMIKVPLLATLLEQVESGAVSFEESHTLTWDEIVGGTGSLQYGGAGSTVTIDRLAWHMIAESDNTATNVLIDRLGFEAINETSARLGLSQTSLNRKMMDYDAIAQGKDNYTCANDLAVVFAMIARGELVSQEQSDRALGYLKDQTDNLGITQGLPAGTVFAHKTGTLDDVRHDGGIVYPADGDPYVLVVLCHLPEGMADTVCANVSSAVWDGRSLVSDVAEAPEEEAVQSGGPASDKSKTPGS